MACCSFRQHHREHAQRIQANQFKWPLKVSPYCCKQQQQQQKPLFSVQAALAVATHCSGNNSCPYTHWSTPLWKVSARLETAAWYMASQLVSGMASESTEWIRLLWFKYFQEVLPWFKTCTAGSYGKQRAGKHSCEKLLPVCVQEK